MLASLQLRTPITIYLLRSCTKSEDQPIVHDGLIACQVGVLAVLVKAPNHLPARIANINYMACDIQHVQLHVDAMRC